MDREITKPEFDTFTPDAATPALSASEEAALDVELANFINLTEE